MSYKVVNERSAAHWLAATKPGWLKCRDLMSQPFQKTCYICAIMISRLYGALGSMMGELGVNIATFHLGRKQAEEKR